MKPEIPESVMPRVNPGESLRAGREARGLSIATAAAQLNLPVSKVQLLEAGEFDKLPGHTFARGYVRSYARLLGMDPNRTVLEFDQFTGTDAAGSEVHALGRIEQPVRASQSLLRIFSLVLLLALAAVGFYWWQERSSAPQADVSQGPAHIEVEGADGRLQYHPLLELEDEAVAAANETPPLEGEPLAADALAAPQAGDPAAAGSSAPAATQQPAAPVAPGSAAAPPATIPPAATGAAPVPAAAEPPAASSAPSMPAGHGLIEVAFSDTCWVQVTDGDGKVLLQGLRRKGETLSLSGKAPLELRLGVASAASVRYNGAAVDIAPFTSNETARVNLGR